MASQVPVPFSHVGFTIQVFHYDTVYWLPFRIYVKFTGTYGTIVTVKYNLFYTIGIDQYCGSEFFHPGSRVKINPDPGSASKNLNMFSLKNYFLSSRKNDLGCSNFAGNIFSLAVLYQIIANLSHMQLMLEAGTYNFGGMRLP
jgi:hypothetical protein